MLGVEVVVFTITPAAMAGADAALGDEAEGTAGAAVTGDKASPVAVRAPTAMTAMTAKERRTANVCMKLPKRWWTEL
ncbi:hypothetical protein [Aeromicrobium sp. 9AM]|uniref:hypothetical protein n=1 Tax=Aeromicrobium sp. 9AM TaxID=2653126 RepID=UPI001F1B2099|nr:hypothetical protein [Aeromicrobium sp. 9AM]